MSRAPWTDERMDDFARNVDRRFTEVDRRFDGVERRMEAGFKRVDGELREIRVEMAARFDSLQRVMFQGAVTLAASFLTVGGAIIATQL